MAATMFPPCPLPLEKDFSACSWQDHMSRRIVTVRSSVSGETAWGPEAVDESMTISEVKARIQEECKHNFNEQRGASVVMVLRQDGRVLPAETALRDLRCRYGEKVDLELAFRELDKNEINQLREMVCADWRALASEAEALASDPEVVLMAVRQDPEALQYASEALRGDMKFVLTAVAINVGALRHCKKRLLSFRRFGATAVRINWRSLQHVAKNLKADEDIVISAVFQDVAALQYADEKLTGDLEFMKVRVLEDYRALKYASPSLQRNDRRVRAAVAKNVKALEYVDAFLLSDRAFMNVMVEQNWAAYLYASPELKEDLKLTSFAVDKAMKFASVALRSGSGTTTLKEDKDMALDFAASTCKTLRLRQQLALGEQQKLPAWKLAGQNWRERKGLLAPPMDSIKDRDSFNSTLGSTSSSSSSSCSSPKPSLSNSSSLPQIEAKISDRVVASRSASKQDPALGLRTEQRALTRASSSSAVVNRLRGDVSLGRMMPVVA